MKRWLLAALLLPSGPGWADGVSHYERHHPDVYFRERGLAAWDAGDARMAFERFVEAARFADKPAQAMVAEAYAQGRGVPRDAVLAYVWMDLAAERGYPLFVGKREHFWKRLDADQRARVQGVGLPVYDEFGDAVAKPRLEQRLRDGKRESPGSRVGAATAFVEVYTNISRGDVGGMPQGTRAPGYYLPQFWNARSYWRAVDRSWERMPEGVVEVSPLRPAK